MNYINKKLTFVIYDYETFGKNPLFDKPAQFASIRVDSKFQILEKPNIFFCRPPVDYLPEIESVLITGITPQKTLNKGLIESEFASKIYKIFNSSNTCILGYNNILFDDEISRNLFYRNLFDPYKWSWKNGNSRWDLLNVVRACYALRPNGIKWPKKKDGLPSFKLEDITKANLIKHKKAHNAIDDVYATLYLARLIQKSQPRLFNYLYKFKNKNQIKKLIDIDGMTPLVYVSGILGSIRSNITWIVPIAWHPNNSNILIICDLNCNIKILNNFKNNKYNNINELIFNKKNKKLIPIYLIYINRCQVLVPINTIRSSDEKRIGINLKNCFNNLTWLKNNPDIKKNIIMLFSKNKFFKSSDNVDYQLYDKFFNNEDLKLMNIIHNTNPDNLSLIDIKSDDHRLKKLFFRYRARNFPYTLNKNEKINWIKYLKNICLTKSRIDNYIKKLNELYSIYKKDNKKKILLISLFKYLQYLIKYNY